MADDVSSAPCANADMSTAVLLALSACYTYCIMGDLSIYCVHRRVGLIEEVLTCQVVMAGI